MSSNENDERIELLIDALEWSLGKGVHAHLDEFGYPAYMVLDAEGDIRDIDPPSLIKPVLDPVVRGGQLNGVATLSPRAPIDPTREAELDAKVVMLEKALEALSAHVQSLDSINSECNAYQNMLIRLIVMGSSATIEDADKRRHFISLCGDLLMHWSRKRGK